MRRFSYSTRNVSRIHSIAAFSIVLLAATSAHAIPTGPEIAHSSGFLLSVQNSNGGPTNLSVSIESRDFSLSQSATGGGITSVNYSPNEYVCGFGCSVGLGPTLFAPGIKGLAKVVDGGGSASISARWQFDIVLRQTDPLEPDGISALLGASWLQPGTVGTAADISIDTVSASWSFAIGSFLFPRSLFYSDMCSAPDILYPHCDGVYPNSPDSSVEGMRVEGSARELSIPVRIDLALAVERDAPFPVPAPGSLLTFFTAIIALAATSLRHRKSMPGHPSSRHS